MYKQEFIDYISKQQNCTKVEAEKIIDIFTNSIISSLGEGKEVVLMGFGGFYASKIEERVGRNPRTGAVLTVPSYIQPKFRAGQKLKDACNSEKRV